MASAETIAKALGDRKAGGGWIARCPGHDDRTPSLSISPGDDGKILLHCHAGCDQAQVIDALRAGGLWEHRGRHYGRRSYKVRQQKDKASERDDTKRTEASLRIWQASVPATGTLTETYLHNGIGRFR